MLHNTANVLQDTMDKAVSLIYSLISMFVVLPIAIRYEYYHKLKKENKIRICHISEAAMGYICTVCICHTVHVQDVMGLGYPNFN